MLQVSDGGANTPCTRLKGGPAIGMCLEPSIGATNSNRLVRLLPADHAGPTIPPPVTSTLSKLLRSQHKGSPINQKLLTIGATEEFCTEFSRDCMLAKPLQAWSLGKGFVSNPPYLLPDGRVRIEWMREGKLEYLSFITFDGSQVKDISTSPAQVPVAGNAVTSAPATAESRGRISPELESAIGDWNNCRTENAYDHAEMPQSAEAIVDKAFETCSPKEGATKTAWLNQFGPGSDGRFEAYRSNFRVGLVAKIESFKTGKPLANDLPGTWGICVRKHVPKPLPAGVSTDEIANAAFAACSPELERVRADFTQKSNAVTGAYVVEQLKAVQRPAIIRQIERAREKR